MESHPWFVSSRRVLETVFPGDKRHLRLADLGCLEGGFAVEFARMGFQVLGIDVRDTNIKACDYVKLRTSLPNLTFVKDNVLNIAEYGMFDAIFCCGLLYHLDQPKAFLETVSSVTTKLLILQTHFSTDTVYSRLPFPLWIRKVLGKAAKNQDGKFALSSMSINEGLPGRWFTEFKDDKSFSRREELNWSSWDNRRAFWIQREYLLQLIQDIGFDCVFEQFDSLGSNIAESMLQGYYQAETRGTFIGIRTHTKL
ncbi:methyltransferase domain-containing protein [Tumidithrix elongata RA019]|uniref:Methyltransferase domain-containing protein n=2 Tax=Tumidithrix TaxID=3088355 RepID=A0AAW9PT61_9CYAN|nr:methyltransferase domain-containing protein [Tumidithrix elongata RA019]